jgi:hypothetical protein
MFVPRDAATGGGRFDVDMPLRGALDLPTAFLEIRRYMKIFLEKYS